MRSSTATAASSAPSSTTIAKLEKLDVSGLEPLAQAVDTHNVFRADEPRPSLSRDAALQNAPEKTGDFFIVPKIIE